MKKIIFLLSLVMSFLSIHAQTIINNPKFSSQTSSLNEITKVELTDTSTNLYFKVKFPQGMYLVISDKSYIQPSDGGDALPMMSFQGIPVGLNNKWEMPASGEVSYSMSYPKLPAGVTSIDFMDEGGGGGSWHIFDIELQQRDTKKVLPESLLGNWLRTDGSNQWEIGFLHNLVIYKNKFWKYSNVNVNKKLTEVNIKADNDSICLYIVSGKKGIIEIGESKSDLVACSQNRTYPKDYKPADNDTFSFPNFNYDTAVYKGYIHGYSSKLGYKTGAIAINNVFTGEQEKYIIEITPEGTFETKVPLYHPIDVFVSFGRKSYSAFLSPGKTTLNYINVLNSRETANTSLFMGDNTAVNMDLQLIGNKNYYYKESYKSLPIWVKILRKGNIFSTYYSFTGDDWQSIQDSLIVEMNTDVYAGLFVTSHNNNVLCETNISHFNINGNTPDNKSFNSIDIGTVNIKGETKYKDGAYIVKGSGNDIWDDADAFRFVYLPLEGDGEIIAKINACSITDVCAKAGVMIRESLLPGSKYAFAGYAPAYIALSQTRFINDSLTLHKNVYTNKILAMSSEEYKAFLLDIKQREENDLLQYNTRYKLNPKSIQLYKIKINIRLAQQLLSYNRNREQLYRRINNISRNQREIPLEFVELEPGYFKEVSNPINNPLSLLCSEYYFLNNATKYADVVRNNLIRPSLHEITQKMEEDGVIFTAEEKKVISDMNDFFKMLSEREDKSISPDELIDKKLEERYKQFLEVYRVQLSSMSQKIQKNLRFFSLMQYFNCNTRVIEIMTSQDYAHKLTSEYKPFTEKDFQNIQSEITDPFIREVLKNENNRLIAKIEENKLKTGYVVNETPKTIADSLFEAITAKYKGKVIYVDFWATWCGPCRNGIKRIAPLKEEMANDSVVFVYITGDSSPQSTWENSIPAIKGEHYKVSGDEWNYLGSKFNITGIPHYVLVNKKGEVVNPAVNHMSNYELKKLLEKYLEE